MVDTEEVFIEDTESNEFDQVIGAIEDIAISNDFEALQSSLLEMYYHHFEVIYDSLKIQLLGNKSNQRAKQKSIITN